MRANRKRGSAATRPISRPMSTTQCHAPPARHPTHPTTALICPGAPIMSHLEVETTKEPPAAGTVDAASMPPQRLHNNPYITLVVTHLEVDTTKEPPAAAAAATAAAAGGVGATSTPLSAPPSFGGFSASRPTTRTALRGLCSI